MAMRKLIITDDVVKSTLILHSLQMAKELQAIWRITVKTRTHAIVEYMIRTVHGQLLESKNNMSPILKTLAGTACGKSK